MSQTALGFFLETHDIEFQATEISADACPHAQTWDLGQDCHHYFYSVLNRTSGIRIGFYFSVGAAWTDPPSIDDVINSVIEEMWNLETTDGFLDWAEATGGACHEDLTMLEQYWMDAKQLRTSLRVFLGPEVYMEAIRDLQYRG